jgi:hypothetical protein
MTATRHDHSPAADADDVAAAIGVHVLQTLGRPADSHRVVVRRLWPGTYRVNVLVGQDVVSTRIAHSYFLRAGDDGTVWDVTPPITRRYESPPADEDGTCDPPS